MIFILKMIRSNSLYPKVYLHHDLYLKDDTIK